MGATYTRQSGTEIVDGEIINAADFNNEFNQLLAFAAASTGHTHDGTTAEGGPITKLLGTAITIGDATAGTDISVTFDGETSDGVLTWMEDEDQFKFSDDIMIVDDEQLIFGTDSNVAISYDETTTDSLKIAATEGAGLAITLMADEGDDAGDEWKLNIADGGTLTLGNDINSAGTYVTHLTVTPNATVANSTMAVAGNLTVANDLTITDDVLLDSDSAVLKFGDDQEITVTHVADTGLNLKHTATGDDKPVVLTLQTGETDIAVNDVIGRIDFQAPDETTGTDAILVAAGIAAVSEGDFSSSNNATKLSFRTAASEAAAEKMSLSSAGNLTISGDLTVSGDDITLGTNTDTAIMVADGTNYNPVVPSGDVTLTNAGVFGIASDVIVNADINSSAAIADSKLATISTADKVSAAAIQIDGATDGTGITIAAGDKLLVDDGGTTKYVEASQLNTYISAEATSIAADNIATGDGAVTIATSSGNITIDAQAGDADIIFKGTDDAADITALTLDMSAAGAATFNDKIIATELDISGDVDVDGTLEADAITVNGSALNTVIAGVTVTNATTAVNATHVSVADNENTNEENLITFIENASATGNVGLESDGDFAYNPSTGTVSATIFKGNIDAVDGDFDGTLETDALSIGGTTVGSTAAELNLLDGSAKSTSSITIDDADAILIIDGTTTKQIPASDISTYAALEATALAIALG
jgi:hypothetical protein